MSGINTGRWLAGGLVAGIVIWLLEGLASLLYMEEMQTVLEGFGLAMEMTATVWALTVVVSLISGLVLVFLYAAARPRFGPGPKTAMIMACTLWLGGWLLSLIGYYMIGLYPTAMLIKWGIIGVIEVNVAALVGGWIYREPAGT
jgi:hypothetical protein